MSGVRNWSGQNVEVSISQSYLFGGIQIISHLKILIFFFLNYI